MERTEHHAYRNETTDRYHVVGDHQTLISAHASVADAWRAIDAMPPIEDTGYFVIHIVYPGVMIESDYVIPDPPKALTREQIDQFWIDLFGEIPTVNS